ncbi:MAG TPA: hypothetical protein VEF76_05595 [Patescibacteria group bacterium]|nr:hypothetical protein [Patescibacteria group bacterium]
MTPAERKRALELSTKATPGPWSFEDDSWVGPSQFSVRADPAPNTRGPAIFGNIEIDSNGLNNLAFITEARSLLPKALLHISTLEGDIENLKAGLGKTSPPIMTLAEITRAKEIVAAATKGEWSWENEPQLGPGIVTVYAGRGAMMHGLNLFGRFDTDGNRDNNLNFITEARHLLPKAIEHLEDLSNEVQRITRPSLVLKPAPQIKPPAPKPPGYRGDDDDTRK